MRRFFRSLLPAVYVFLAVFIAGARFTAWRPPVDSYSPALWEPVVFLVIGIGVFAAYFWPPRRDRGNKDAE